MYKSKITRVCNKYTYANCKIDKFNLISYAFSYFIKLLQFNIYNMDTFNNKFI